MGWVHNMIEKGKFAGVEPGEAASIRCSLPTASTSTPTAPILVDCTWYAAFYRESPEGKLLPLGTKLSPRASGHHATAGLGRGQELSRLRAVRRGHNAGRQARSDPGRRPGIGEATAVTLSSPTPGAWFRYTLDGTTPTRTRGYVYCGVVSVRPGMTVKAVAYKSGMADSPVAEFSAPGRHG